MKFYRSLTAVWMSVFVALVLPGPATGGVWNRHSKGAPAPQPVSSQLISKPSAQISERRALELYGRQPLTFEVNYGQADEPVRYLARGSGYTLFLTAEEAVLVVAQRASGAGRPTKAQIFTREARLAAIKPGAKSRTESSKSAVLRMKLVDANPQPELVGLEELPGKVNYFIGNNPGKWRTNIPTYAKVRYRDVYPGVDLIFYGNRRQLEYDFALAPGADPGSIALLFEGADKVEVDRQGDLVFYVAGKQIRQRKPFVYQETNGIKRQVSVSYVLKDRHLVGFDLGAYDTAKPLVIDPVIVYSTYLGGSTGGEQVIDIAVDASGNAYLTGFTTSANFPTTPGAFDTTPDYLGPGYPPDYVFEAFVAKLNGAGTGLVYSSYLGGALWEEGTGIAVNTSGNAYVTGFTSSFNFPTTVGAFDTSLESVGKAFVVQLDGTGGALIYSTFLGKGSATAIAVHSGNAYVIGQTSSPDFPTTPGAFSTVNTISCPTCNCEGPEPDLFVSVLNPTGTALVYSTLFGGWGFDGWDVYGGGIAVDASGRAYITGATMALDFPTTPGAFDTTPIGPNECNNNDGMDAFISVLDPTAAGPASLVYSSYLGGSSQDEGFRIALDNLGNAYVTGATHSSDFPTTPGAFDTSYNGNRDVFVAKLNIAASGAASLVYSTYLGGSGSDFSLDVAVDSFGSAYVTGLTQSTDFPVTNALQSAAPSAGVSDDAFITKLNAAGSGLVWSTYLGGSSGPYSSYDIGLGIAVDTSGNVYVSGETQSTDFPTQNPLQPSLAGASDGFVARINGWRDTETIAPGQAVTVSSAPGGTGEAGVTATLTNNTSGTTTATVTVENYSSNPGTTNVIDLGGRYVDLRVSGADSTDSVTAKFYYPSTVTGTPEAELILTYYDPATNTWPEVRSSGGASPLKDTTDNLDNTISGGRFTVIFDNTSTPTITQLTGTVFTSSVTPLGAIRVLISRIGSLNLNAGQKNSLASKLEAALHSLLRGNRNAAINQLGAFVNEVQALQRTGQLGTADAESLIRLAQAIISLI